MHRLNVLLVALALLSNNAIALPLTAQPTAPNLSKFVGSWLGQPATSVVGPFSSPFAFNVQPAPVGWLMSDNFTNHSEFIRESWQHFWVYENEGLLLYCGILKHFFSQSEPTKIAVPFYFQANQSSDTRQVFCFPAESGGCNFASWTLTVIDDNSFHSQVLISTPVKHADITFRRGTPSDALTVPSVPSHPSCNFTDISEKPPLAALCPHRRRSTRTPKPPTPASEVSLLDNDTPALALANCYNLNDEVGVTLSWTADASTGAMEVTVSMKAAPTDWIAIGFSPNFPGMQGADIVLGYVPGDSAGCVRTMYAADFVGTPVDSTALVVSDATVQHADGMTTLTFSRNMTSGKSPLPKVEPPTGPLDLLVMWAAGDATGLDCSAAPSYHGDRRGIRAISWLNASGVMPPNRKCH